MENCFKKLKDDTCAWTPNKAIRDVGTTKDGAINASKASKTTTMMMVMMVKRRTKRTTMIARLAFMTVVMVMNVFS